VLTCLLVAFSVSAVTKAWFRRAIGEAGLLAARESAHDHSGIGAGGGGDGGVDGADDECRAESGESGAPVKVRARQGSGKVLLLAAPAHHSLPPSIFECFFVRRSALSKPRLKYPQLSDPCTPGATRPLTRAPVCRCLHVHVCMVFVHRPAFLCLWPRVTRRAGRV